MPLVYVTPYKRGWIGDPKTFGYTTTSAPFSAGADPGRVFSTVNYLASPTSAPFSAGADPGRVFSTVNYLASPTSVNWSAEAPEIFSMYDLYAQAQVFGNGIGYIGAIGDIDPTSDYRNETILGVLSYTGSFVFWITGDVDTPITYIERIYINNKIYLQSTAAYDPQHGDDPGQGIQYGPSWTWNTSAGLVANTLYSMRIYWKV